VKLLEDVLSFHTNLLFRSGWIEIFFLSTFVSRMFIELPSLSSVVESADSNSKNNKAYRDNTDSNFGCWVILCSTYWLVGHDSKVVLHLLQKIVVNLVGTGVNLHHVVQLHIWGSFENHVVCNHQIFISKWIGFKCNGDFALAFIDCSNFILHQSLHNTSILGRKNTVFIATVWINHNLLDLCLEGVGKESNLGHISTHCSLWVLPNLLHNVLECNASTHQSLVALISQCSPTSLPVTVGAGFIAKITKPPQLIGIIWITFILIGVFDWHSFRVDTWNITISHIFPIIKTLTIWIIFTNGLEFLRIFIENFPVIVAWNCCILYMLPKDAITSNICFKLQIWWALTI